MLKQSLSIAVLIASLLLVGHSQEDKGGKAQPDRTLPWVTDEAKAPRVEFRTFDSKKVGGKVSYHVYTPETYGKTEARLPVLYWLHATDGGIVGIRPIAKVFDDAIKAGKAPAMIVVFVNGLPRRLWADSKDGSAPVETVFVKELIPEVDKQYRTIAKREGRILEGFSMGGYGAARIGFRHPDLFAGVSILAGGPLDLEFKGPRANNNPMLRRQILADVCSGDMEYFKSISPWMVAESSSAEVREKKMVIRHAVGKSDDTRELNAKFHERMESLKVPHEYAELPEVAHDVIAIFDALGERNGRFYARALGLADPELNK
jgi:enterochelin esterase-like enzyme